MQVESTYHVVATLDGSVLADLPCGVVGDGGAPGRSRNAGVALIHGRALLINGAIVVASLIGDSVALGVSPDGEMITTLAGTGVGTGEDVLDGKVTRWESSVLLYVDAISKSRGGALCPA